MKEENEDKVTYYIRVKRNYQKDLNPRQKLTLELLHHNDFSVGDWLPYWG